MGTLTRDLTVAIRLLGLALFGCEPAVWQSPQEAPHREGEVSRVSVPIAYTTTPTPHGIRGGEPAEELARKVREHFRELTLQPDGRLADVAARFVFLAQEQRRIPDAVELDELARERGIVGPCPFVFLVPYVQGGWQDLQQLMAAIPGNLRFTHLGVAVIPTGGALQGAVAVGAQHLALDPLPRHVGVNETLAFKGKIAGEYRESRWVWTLPDGSTRPLVTSADGVVSFTTDPLGQGVHRFEAFGVGPSGLEVLANFPVSVGSARIVAERAEPTVAGADPVPALVQLINQARARAGAKPLIQTVALDRIAIAHSTDMVDSHFTGHRSPVTGELEDRLGSSRVRLLLAGENVARAASASVAHRMLMNSPGHRQNILNPRFTHVGIGVVVKLDERPPSMSITQVFGSFPEPLTDPAGFATNLFEQLNRARSQGNLAPVSRKRALDAAAAKIAARVAADPTIKAEEVDRLARTSDFSRIAAEEVGLLALFPAVPEEIAPVQHLLDPSLRSVGIGVVQAEPTVDSPRTNVALFVLSKRP